MRTKISALILAISLCWPLSAHAVQFGAGSGSSYPTTLDTTNTRANKSGGTCSSSIASNICAEFTNDLQSAVRAIQLELGTLPKGAFADVAARLNTGMQTPWTTDINAAGHTLYGSTQASGNLTLDSTSSGTKGYVILNPSGGNVGIGTAPSELFSLNKAYAVNISLEAKPNLSKGFIGYNGENVLIGNNINISGVITNPNATATSISVVSHDGSGYIAFNTSPTNNTTPPERVRITAEGRVGVGIDPSVQFELSGAVGQKASGTTWSNPSDARLKENVRDYMDGLDIIRKIRPVRYELNGLAGTPKGQQGISIIAQEMLQAMPYTIETYQAKLHPDDTEATALYRFDASAVTFALINAVKELATRVEQLEAH